jgi:hypothetical protein
VQSATSNIDTLSQLLTLSPQMCMDALIMSFHCKARVCCSEQLRVVSLLCLSLGRIKLNIFNVHASILHNNILIYIQQDAMLHSVFYVETALHVLGGTITHHQEHKQLSTASGTCHILIAICRYRGRVGTGLSVLWVAYAY